VGTANRKRAVTETVSSIVVESKPKMSGRAIGRCRHYKVIAITVWFKTAIHPDKIYLTGVINARGEEDIISEVGIPRERGYGSHSGRATPTCTAVI
jgi:hypothetical protein